MRLSHTVLFTFFLALIPITAQTAGTPSLAVVVTKSPTLSPQETVALKNTVAKGFQETNKYRIVDAETLNNMLEDEVAEALLLGNEGKLDEIQQKYQVDVLVNLSAKVESSIAIGGYSMASASVTIACRRNDNAMLFDQQTSEPQNGYHGMPEWLGSTGEAARKVAMQAAVASVFTETGIESVEFPMPERLQLKLEETSQPAQEISYLPKYTMEKTEAKKLSTLVEPSIGRRDKMTCSVLDSGKRIAAVGITGIDIDLQRRRRLDTARFEVFDVRKKRQIREMALPRTVEGIRRPKSRDIVDIAFAPTGRFIAIVSKHPALWLYDNLSGDMLTQIKLASAPEEVFISKDGSTLKIKTSGRDLFYTISKK